eukprot:CAMPEP_0178975756 /NCGR_PEP_ID=MMETSP0789-20121207/23388_1 /TAXON_ID=3005 /ORGANISM="Rhizosolenia setigera, Strain CCMP 1694" /LENGTH=295 /DNA_ID=CAMNT_0020664635 /DNA_START=246 /DNA_END=1134 /DNA_ORIENTATION=+
MKLSIKNLVLFFSASAYHVQAQTSSKIVGGTEASPGRYTYQAALIDSDGDQFCGGSLILSGWVLSAAHCVDNPGDVASVQIGRIDLTDSSETYEDIVVLEEILHPDWNSDTEENDIMLLKLATDSMAQVVTYDTGSADTSAGIDVTVMGWGKTTEGGSSSDKLLEVELDIVSNADCGAEDAHDGEITDVMLCAARDGKDSCQGDSGGPLIIAGADATTDVQIGVAAGDEDVPDDCPTSETTSNSDTETTDTTTTTTTTTTETNSPLDTILQEPGPSLAFIYFQLMVLAALLFALF